MANAMIAVDAACYFSTIIYIISNNFVLNWNTLYARIVHYFWTILQYSCLFIYGAVWSDRVYMGLAIGYITRIMFIVSIPSAKTEFDTVLKNILGPKPAIA